MNTSPRAAAIEALHAPVADDFLRAAGVETPVPDVPGVLPAVGRKLYGARELKRAFDLMVVYRVGDFEGAGSTYFDPQSPWYNVSYGAYGVRSYKANGAAWGFLPDGHADFDELLEVLKVDYDFLIAPVPAGSLCFHVENLTKEFKPPWAVAEVLATIPSGLHAGASTPELGAAAPAFSVGRPDFEPVAMVGKMFFRAVQPSLTLAWGGLCPATPAGEELLAKIIAEMSRLYL